MNKGKQLPGGDGHGQRCIQMHTDISGFNKSSHAKSCTGISTILIKWNCKELQRGITGFNKNGN